MTRILEESRRETLSYHAANMLFLAKINKLSASQGAGTVTSTDAFSPHRKYAFTMQEICDDSLIDAELEKSCNNFQNCCNNF